MEKTALNQLLDVTNSYINGLETKAQKYELEGSPNIADGLRNHIVGATAIKEFMSILLTTESRLIRNAFNAGWMDRHNFDRDEGFEYKDAYEYFEKQFINPTED